ncbi:ester cyclase [Actinoplanes sp. NPDC049265]|uniref:ester cyclase n=1 Tax=Actinoplanes sp. NPDC049265 TaxID=3363902 RepID=UPI003714B4AB
MFTVRKAAAMLVLPLVATGALTAASGGAAPAAERAPFAHAASSNLRKFDVYDFVVFNGHDWSRVKESHAANIVVYQPDGSITRGLAAHLKELESYSVYAPDARISKHVLSFASGDLTQVSGVFEGTFTRPMPDGKGGFIPPTGKAFSVPISTAAKWRNGKIVEKHVYLDVRTFLGQIGLAG